MSQDEEDRRSEDSNQHIAMDLDELSPPPSNEKLLCIAFVSFQSFAMVQLGASIIAGSQAMLGDSIAMMVDALAYLFNLIAERKKEEYASKLQQQNKLSSTMTSFTRSKMVLEYRQYTYKLELVPPIFSVFVLIVLTTFVLKEAIHTLILDRQRDVTLQSDPDVNLMVMFSFFNLLLDVLNVGCFASASHALGYKTEMGETRETYRRIEREDNDFDNGVDNYADYDDNSEKTDTEKDTTRTSGELHDCDDPLNGGKNDDSINLNMCSAYTHVFADTLRSLAVILASLLAKFTNTITSEVADAAAAVVVSLLIFVTLFPLIGGMIVTFTALRDINRQLRMKEMEEKEEGKDQIELLRFAKIQCDPL